MVESIYQRMITAPRLANVRAGQAGSDGKKIRGTAAVYYDGTPRTQFVLATRADGSPRMVERVFRVAFDRVLRDKVDVVALLDHDSGRPLARVSARTLRLWSDRAGLQFEFTPPDAPDGWNAAEAVHRGDLCGCSFSFTVRDEIYREQDGMSIRELRDLDVREVSLVTWPAYQATGVHLRSANETNTSTDVLRRRLDLAAIESGDRDRRSRFDMLRARLDLEAML